MLDAARGLVGAGAALRIAAAGAPTAAPAAAEPAQIAEDLVKERQFAPRGWRRARRRCDVLCVLEPLVIDRRDHAILGEVDDIDLLIGGGRQKERRLGSAFADVVPGIGIKDADARRRSENLDDLVLRRLAGVDLRDCIGCQETTPLLVPRPPAP